MKMFYSCLSNYFVASEHTWIREVNISKEGVAFFKEEQIS